MLKFYIKTCFTILMLTFLISCKKDSKKTEIILDKEVNLGTVSSFDTVHFNINVINPMKEDLIIKKASTSCGYTLVSIKDSIVKPNHKTQLNLEFIPGLNRKGNVSQAIVIEANTTERFHEFIIKAHVK